MPSDGAVSNRRQVLPPIPGYIPVYIQHGDIPPEDPEESAAVSQVADKNVPSKLSPTVYISTTTSGVTENLSTYIRDSITDNSNNNEPPASSNGRKIGTSFNGVPEDSNSNMFSVNSIKKLTQCD